MRKGAAALGLHLVAAGSLLAATSAPARPLDDIRNTGVVRIAIYRDNPPFSFRKDGELVGIDIEIGRRVAKQLGVEASFMEVTAGDTMDADLRNAIWKGHYLGGGTADFMLDVPYDPLFARRNPQVALFAPYSEEEFVVVSDPARVGPDPDLLGLRSTKIGVELASLADFYLISTLGGALRDAVVHFRTSEDAAQALVERQVGAVMASRSLLEAALGDRLRLLQVQPADFRGFARSRWPLGIAVNENSRDLGYAVEDAVAELVANGGFSSIYRAFGVTYKPPQAPEQ